MCTYLVIFELLDALMLLSLSLSLDGVGPLGDTVDGDLLQLFSLLLPHGLVVLVFVSLLAHELDSLQLVVSEH